MKKSKLPILLLSLVFFAMLPVTMVVPVMKEIIKDNLSAGNVAVALFTSVSMLGSFIFSPIAGLISDKLGDRRTIIAIACFVDAFLFLLITFVQDINVLMFVRFMEGGTHIFVIGLLLASVSDLENNPNSSFYKQGRLMGIAGMFLSLGAAIGMPIGILGKSNPMIPFYAGSFLLFSIGIVSLSFLRDNIHSGQKEFRLADLSKSIQLNPYLLVPFAFHFIDRFTVGFLVSSFNIYLRENLSFHPGKAGAYLSLVLLPMSILSYPSAILSRKYGLLPLVLGGSFMYGGFLSATGWTDDPVLLFIYLMLAGIGAGVMYVPSMILASRMSPNGLNGTVMSAFTGLGSLGFMCGPICSVYLEKFYYQIFASEQAFPALSTSFGLLEICLVLCTIPFLYRINRYLSKENTG
ncbi:MFS transporter [Leptospira sp. GIMC2001]|uniref:MFS transporter n=1 Tax=Leptospira sp. GIMC2001 TaxID=1513297 RepID=UPI00234BE283|nr:MFS transporter [Leptospira sp. GIMC2001]WCL49238.1 MFS transporter [Leptospira sp. GIMC2001]